MHPPPALPHQLSKSTFLIGMQCTKRLWLQKNKPGDKTRSTDSEYSLFSKGKYVGALARSLYPDGKDASPQDYDYKSAMEKTYDWIRSGEQVIYEASFQYQGLFASVDILVKQGKQWHAYEVKSSTSVKEHHYLDAAFQYYVMQGAGLDISGISVIHINNKYVLHGELNLKHLFHKVSIRHQVLQLQESIAEKVQELLAISSRPEVPVVDIGPHCMIPHACDFLDQCWGHISSPSVFDLAHLGTMKKFDLYYQGYIKLDEIPEGYTLSAGQQLQIKSTLEKEVHIDREALRNWLGSLQYPLLFMDFECFQPAVPLYEGSRPFQQVPFQFSVHRLREQGAELEHTAFIGDPVPDPRLDFLKALLKAVEGGGTVLAYNQSFEISRLKDLAIQFPEYKEPVNELIKRIRDLMEPFLQKWYYAPEMHGSYSIKMVLPALVPELSYEGMAIADGQAASYAFESLMYIKEEEKRKKIKEDLLQYCNLDTEAMVKVWEVLKMES
jgi:Domain of unknown function(DUF2779)/Domain of unknown function DUF83